MYNLAQTGHLSKKERSGYASDNFKKRLKRIEEILRLKQEEITKESIHELRLEIKKVKAVFTLLAYINNNFPLHRYYRPFKTVFEKAGDIRTVQIEQELLKNYISDPSDRYLDQLKKLVEEKSNALGKKVRSHTVVKLKSSKKGILSFLNKISENQLKQFLKKKSGKLVRMIERKIFEEQYLHLLRKKLKRFYFIARMLYPDVTIPEPWNRLMELLGKWHDEQIAIEHLRKAIYSSRFSQDEINRLHDIKRKITDNREDLFDQIVATYFLIESNDGRVNVPDNSLVSQIQ